MKYLCLVPTSLYDASSYEKVLKAAYDKDIFKVVKGLDKVVHSAAEKLSGGVAVYTIMSDNAAQRLAKIIRGNTDLFSEVRPSKKGLSFEMRHLFVSEDRLRMRHVDPSESEHKPGLDWLASLECVQTYLMLYPMFENIHTSEIKPGVYSLADFESSGFAPFVSEHNWETRHVMCEYEQFCGESNECDDPEDLEEEDFEEEEDEEDEEDLEDADFEDFGYSPLSELMASATEKSAEPGNEGV